MQFIVTRHATIDIGSNTILLLIADITPDGRVQPVLETGRTTRLARKLTAGRRLHETSVQHSIETLHYFVSLCHEYGVHDIVAVGTQALRLAQDAQNFLRRVKTECGVVVRIISFEEEAHLSYLAVERDPSMPAPAAVIDVGGGSTEFLLPLTEPKAITIPLGSVRLTERYVSSDPPGPDELARIDQSLRGRLRNVPTKVDGDLVGIGGTLVTMAMIHAAHVTFDPRKVHGMRLTLDSVHRIVERLAGVALIDRRKIIGLPADRADIIVAGAMIVRAAMTHLDRQELCVSSRGLRYGLLYQHALE